MEQNESVYAPFTSAYMVAASGRLTVRRHKTAYSDPVNLKPDGPHEEARALTGLRSPDKKQWRIVVPIRGKLTPRICATEFSSRANAEAWLRSDEGERTVDA